MSFDDDNGNFEEAGIIVLEDRHAADPLDNLAHAVLDDVLYNLIHDIVLKTHREEKIAKANSAAILVEQLAFKTASDQFTSETLSESRPPIRAETEAAIYEDGVTYIKGNPLVTTKEILCPKCLLPRLLYPTVGKGARPPVPGKKYCERHPYIDRPNHDIYGIPFPKDDEKPTKKSRQSKSAAANHLIPTNSQTDGVDSSFESPGPSPPPTDQSRDKVTAPSYPYVNCPNCSRRIVIRQFAKHLQSCAGYGGRQSGRTAMSKIQSQQSASRHGSTPPISRIGTPVAKSSPQKRSAVAGDEDQDDDEDEISEVDSDDEESSPRKKRKKKIENGANQTKAAVKPKPKLKLSAKPKVAPVTKKWKSGKVTVDGKIVEDTKKENKAREESESSQTLSSP